MLAASPEGQQFTGAATTRVPIDVPPGRNGMQPNLALVYSSQAGSGPYGSGWDLPVGRIERSRRQGVPRYGLGEVFTLVLPEGGAELVQLPDGTYAARIDDGRARIVANVGANTWTLNDRSGRTYTFGATAAARVGPSPGIFGSTFAWHLTQVRDRKGNTVEIEYEQTGGGHAYLKKIGYGGNVALSLGHVYEVTFAYELRPGATRRLSYGAGFREEVERNLEVVTVRRASGETVRTYDLVWAVSATNAAPLLAEVRLLGSDGSPLRLENGQDASSRFAYHEKPTIPFGAHRFEDLQVNWFRDESEVGGPEDLCTKRDFVDLDGDGRPDLVRTAGWSAGNPVWQVRLNQGPSSPTLFGPAISWPAPAPCLVERHIDADSHLGTTHRAVIDMNGDGRPDHVSVAQNELRVFLNDGARFVSPYQVWATGLPALREGNVQTGEVRRDLIDLNADGRPDGVHAQLGGVWQVRWNLGTSLGTAANVPGPTLALRNGGPDSGDRTIRTDVFDVNGDAVPDKVVAVDDASGRYWKIWFGTGTGFASGWTRWDGAPRPFIRAWNAGQERFDYDVLDVTGDGLPDFVDAIAWTAASPYWRVYANSGSGFLAARTWAAPAPLRRRHDEEVFHALQSDTFDVDGDGFVDVVKLAGGPDTVAEISLGNPGTGATDTLLHVTSNQFASYTELAYSASTRFASTNVDPALHDHRPHLPFPIWVVTRITTTDGTAEGTVRQRFRYDGGYFDGARREFRGFQWAWRTDDHGMTEETRFHQADPLQGRERGRRILARDPATTGSPGVLQTVAMSWTSSVSGGRFLPRLESRGLTHHGSARDAPWSETASRTFTSTFTYDNCGNLTREQVVDAASPAVSLSDNSASFYGLAGGCTVYGVCAGICDRVQATSEVGGLSKTYTYDAGGTLASVKTLGAGDPTHTMAYDAYGNLTRVTNPRGVHTDYTYDADRLRATTRVEDAAGKRLTTSYVYDRRFGKVTSQAGPACDTTQYEYDVFGRLVKVIEAGQSSAQPTRYLVYVLGSRPRLETHVLELEPAPHYRAEVQIFDALGRALQRQADRLVQGSARTVITDAVLRQEGGRVVKQYVPRIVGTGASVYSPVPANHPGNVFVHDEFGRVTIALTADDRILTASRATALVTRSCDAKHGANPSQGACMELEVDGLGRTVAERTYLGNGATPYTSRSLVYGPFGTVTRERQNADAATDIVTTLDALGRKVSVSDADSGLWRYGYDANGNLVYQDDPVTGQHVEIAYDSLDRPTLKRRFTADPMGQGTPSTLAAYTYDSAVCGAGRLRTVDDLSGQTVLDAYDARGNVLRGQKRISFDGVSKAFSSASSYDALGRLKSSRYPFPDADGAETVFYDYGSHGALTRIRSDHGAYLLDVRQDEFGRPMRVEYGNGVVDVAGYQAVSGGFRLGRLYTQKPGQALLRDVRYEDYDENGNVRAIRDLINLPGDPESLTQVATYDDAGRLTTAVQCGGGRYAGSFLHDRLGNLTGKDGTSYSVGADGPHQPSAAGTEALAYDANGSMTRLPGDRTLHYDAEGRLVRVERGGVEIARYLYDFSGRRVAARGPEGTTLFFGAFDWRAGTVVRYLRVGERLIAASPVSDSGVFAAHTPASPPVVVARVVGGAVALGLLGVALVVPGRRRLGPLGRPRRGSVALLAMAVFLAQLPALPADAGCPDPTTGPPPPGTLFYHPDHIGTPQLLTDDRGTLVERLVHRPYGALGGVFDRTGAQLEESQSAYLFTGHRASDATSLIYMGARYFDPGLGMFVSQDPADQFFSPYSYGTWNPLNGRDPNGASWLLALVIGAVISGFIIGSAVASIQAWVNGASVGQTAKASAIGGAIGAGSGAALGVVGGAVGAAGSTTLSVAYNAALSGYAVYGAVESFQNEQYVVGSAAILGAALSLFGVYGAATGPVDGDPGGRLQFVRHVATENVSDAMPEYVLPEVVVTAPRSWEWYLFTAVDVLSLASLVYGLTAAAGVGVRAAAARIAARGVSNPIPKTLARVIPGRGPFTSLGRQGADDVFVTAAEDIRGMRAAEFPGRLGIDESDVYTVIEFPTPGSGLASPVNRTNPLFVGGGRTIGGAREFVVPNVSVPVGAKVTVVR
jgi:RHS repeat-associated protein